MSHSPLKVDFEVKHQAKWLRLHYDAQDLLTNTSDIKAMLLDSYRQVPPESSPSDAVLEITSDIATSKVVFSMFVLYKEIAARRGVMVCLNYPKNYMHSIQAL